MGIGLGGGIAIAKILATLGQGYFASRDAERMRREQEKAQAEQDRRAGISNLINAFGGRSVPSPVNYTPSGPGIGSNLLGALGTAADVAGIYHGATKADTLRNLQMENIQGQMAQRDLTTDVARGTTLGQGAGLISDIGQSVKEWRPSFTPPPQAPGLGVLRGGDTGAALRGGLDVGKAPAFNVPPPLLSTQVSPPTDLSDVGQAAFRAAQSSRRAAQGATQRKITQQQYENLLSGRGQLAAERKLLADERKLDLELWKFRDKLNQVGQMKPEQIIAAEKGLRGDFMRLTTDFKKIGDSFQTILAGADDPTAASDLSLIFAFMKMLDPTSVVRESEFQTAEQSGALSDTITNRLARLWDGERLKVTRGDFLRQAMEVYQSKIPGYVKISEEFRAIATRSKLDPLNVVLDFRINLEKANTLIQALPPPLSRIPDDHLGLGMGQGVPPSFQGGPYVPATGQGGGYMGSPVGPLPGLDFNFWRRQRQQQQGTN